MLTIDELNEIKARADAASNGPWIVEAGDYSGSNWLIASMLVGTDWDTNTYQVHITTDHLHADEVGGDGAKADAEFIAHAREDIPKLLKEIARLRSVDGSRENAQAAGWVIKDAPPE